MKEKCEGCIDIYLSRKECIILSRLIALKNSKLDYKDCVCMNCIIKVVCKIPCEEVRTYAHDLMIYSFHNGIHIGPP